MLAGAFACGMLFQRYGVPVLTNTTYFKLKEPLRLQSESTAEASDFHMLPTGTALYKDWTFPEGHTRYLVYLNVKGPIAAERVDSNQSNLVDPIWAYRVQRKDFQPTAPEQQGVRE